MTLHVLGTSNCVQRDSFIYQAAEYLKQPIVNLSIGGSSSAAGLWQLSECKPQPGDILLLDFVINDQIYFSSGISSLETLETHLATLVGHGRAAGAFVVVVILPSLNSLIRVRQVEEMQVRFCQKNRVPYCNVAQLFRQTVAKGVSAESLMADNAHMSVALRPRIGTLVGQAIEALMRQPRTLMSLPLDVVTYARIQAVDLLPKEHHRLRKNSLRQVPLAALSLGESVMVPVASDQQIVGIQLNTGAFGGILKMEGSGTPVVKSAIIYWNKENPARFITVLTGMKQPVRPGPEGVRISLVDADTPVTEPTHHGQPIINGRYGEVELEGFLTTSQKTHTVEQMVEALPLEALEGIAVLGLPDGFSL